MLCSTLYDVAVSGIFLLLRTNSKSLTNDFLSGHFLYHYCFESLLIQAVTQ